MPTDCIYPCENRVQLIALLKESNHNEAAEFLENQAPTDSEVNQYDSGNIDHLMSWSITPQGHEFWRRIHYKLKSNIPLIKREDWEPSTHPSRVGGELRIMIQKCYERCDILPPDSIAPQNYPFTHIDFAVSDRGRISGVAFNKLQSLAYEEYINGDRSKHLNDVYYDLAYYSVSNDFRQQHGTFIKPGKLIAAISPDLDQSKITCVASELANALRLRANPDVSILQISNKPSEIYTIRSDFDSCMKQKSEARFKLYDDLCNTRILYYIEDSTLKGRALIHENVMAGGHDIISLMDRIYYANGVVLALFETWAIKNGHWRKKEQRLGCNDYFKPNGDLVEGVYMTIDSHDLREVGYTELPYVDTFSHYSEDNKTLSSDSHDADTCLQDTDGTDCERLICGGGGVRCYECGEYIDEDDIAYIHDNAYCYDCRDHLFTYCDSCDEYYRNVYITQAYDRRGNEVYVCEGCLSDNYTCCEACGDYHWHENVTEVDDCWYCEEHVPTAEPEDDSEDDSNSDSAEDSEVSESLQLEVGKKYVARNGDILTIARRSVLSRWPWASAEDSHGDTYTFTDSGRCGVDPQYDHDFDLLREYVEPLKLEVGRSYVDRRGVTVMIVEKQSSGWPFRGNNEQLYREDGTWDTTVGHECEFDLVKEVSLTLAEVVPVPQPRWMSVDTGNPAPTPYIQI